ncbi:hypothetical protein IQ266_21375 [filamentous cyanobacterium LEGE 11480]|uniref:Uncharacterized protein n=1 Tax=Romeriopsis navalis LEGE 11480 TaxID=2777977 RepID=A0A928VPA9_9CYAN|nr:hypothetical protein [Romeriopsis navalis]MBE9032293.1 hypothetical protein [Romeriopsis navalis LEGE 11480]
MQPHRPEPHNNSTRYWLARLKPIAKPQVWLSGLGLIGMMVFAWEFSQRPEWRQALLKDNSTPAADSTDPESQAIAADIDSLSLLNADLRTAQQRLNAQETDTQKALAQIQQAQSKGSDDAKKLNRLSIEALFGSANKAIAKTPRLTDGLTGNRQLGDNNGFTSPNRLLGSTLNGIGNAVRAPGLTNTGLNNGVLTDNRSALTNRLNSRNGLTPNQLGTGNSALSTALNRYSPAQANPSAPFQVKPSEPTPTATPRSLAAPIAGSTALQPTTTTQINSPIAGSSAINPALLSAPKSGLNSYTGLTRGVVTGVTASPTLTRPSIRQPSTAATLRRSVGGSTPGRLSTTSTSIPVSPGSTPLPPGTVLSSPTRSTAPVRDIPFTAPRSIPGRRIGGGQIGTFSNP